MFNKEKKINLSEARNVEPEVDIKALEASLDFLKERQAEPDVSSAAETEHAATVMHDEAEIEPPIHKPTPVYSPDSEVDLSVEPVIEKQPEMTFMPAGSMPETEESKKISKQPDLLQISQPGAGVFSQPEPAYLKQPGPATAKGINYNPSPVSELNYGSVPAPKLNLDNIPEPGALLNSGAPSSAPAKEKAKEDEFGFSWELDTDKKEEAVNENNSLLAATTVSDEHKDRDPFKVQPGYAGLEENKIGAEIRLNLDESKKSDTDTEPFLGQSKSKSVEEESVTEEPIAEESGVNNVVNNESVTEEPVAEDTPAEDTSAEAPVESEVQEAPVPPANTEGISDAVREAMELQARMEKMKAEGKGIDRRMLASSRFGRPASIRMVEDTEIKQDAENAAANRQEVLAEDTLTTEDTVNAQSEVADNEPVSEVNEENANATEAQAVSDTAAETESVTVQDTASNIPDASEETASEEPVITPQMVREPKPVSDYVEPDLPIINRNAVPQKPVPKKETSRPIARIDNSRDEIAKEVELGIRSMGRISGATLLKNPLPHPKKHIQRNLGYDYEPTEDQMHFDLEDMTGIDFYDV